MRFLHSLAHWFFYQESHKHLYAYHAIRAEEGPVRFYWKCVYFFCGAEVDDEDD